MSTLLLRALKLAIVTAPLFGLLIPDAYAAETATLSGIVRDPSDAAITNAEVTVHEQSTGADRRTSTNDSGLFTAPALPPGTYSVKITASGFKTIESTDIHLSVAEVKQIDFTLEVGDVRQTVSVEGSSALDTSDGSVSTVIDRAFVEDLPLNGRSFQSLITLTPGVVTNSPQSTGGLGQTGEFSVNGQRTEENRYSVDGVSANNGTAIGGFGSPGATGSLAVASALGTTQSLVAVDALQEFRIESSSYSAEYGCQPGGQFLFTTRSGTNDFHGTAYDFLRNNVFDANDWFNDAYGKPPSALRQNDFGFTLGGPLLIPRVYDGKNRTFFFFSYEGLRLRQPIAATPVYVPSETLRQQAPEVLQPVLSAFPYVPTSVGQDIGNGLATFILTDSLPSAINSTSLRIDHNVASWLHLSFRFSYAPSDSLARGYSILSTTRIDTRSYTFGATSPFSSTVVNDFRLAYSSNTASSIDSLDNIGGAKPVNLFALQGISQQVDTNPEVDFYLFFPGYSALLYQDSNTHPQQQWNAVDTVTFTHGRHAFKMGVDYLRTTSQFQRNSPLVQVDYDTAANLLANNSYESFVAAYAHLFPRYINLSTFAQDQWRPSARLNVSFGVRWEIDPAPRPTQGSFPFTIQGDLTNPQSFTLAPAGARLWNTKYDNFAPRAGLAYVLRNDPGWETVWRSGAGIFFDTGQQDSAFGLSNGPGSFAFGAYGTTFGSSASFPLGPAMLAVPLSLTPPYPNTYTYPTNLRLPYTLQWSSTVEQSIGKSQTLTVAYVGAGGRELLAQRQLNASLFNPLFISDVVVVSNGLSSSYNALQIKFQRKLDHGFQVLTSYTWSHSIDYGSQNTSLPYQRGDSDFDLTDNFSAALSYEIPAHFSSRLLSALGTRWAIDARISARSGFPVTLQGNLLTNPATGAQFYGGLNIVPGVPVYLESPAAPGGREIDSAAFTLPTGNQEGTAPRNFLRGFGASQFDVALRREFPLGERVRLQFRAEAFNALNHPEFGFINTTYGNALFGQATTLLNGSLGGLSPLYQQGGPRSMQFSLKVLF